MTKGHFYPGSSSKDGKKDIIFLHYVKNENELNKERYSRKKNVLGKSRDVAM